MPLNANIFEKAEYVQNISRPFERWQLRPQSVQRRDKPSHQCFSPVQTCSWICWPPQPQCQHSQEVLGAAGGSWRTEQTGRCPHCLWSRWWGRSLSGCRCSACPVCWLGWYPCLPRSQVKKKHLLCCHWKMSWSNPDFGQNSMRKKNWDLIIDSSGIHVHNYNKKGWLTNRWC